MNLDNLYLFIISTITSTGIMAFIGYFFREGISRLFNQLADRNIEKYKSELSQQADILKFDLQKDIINSDVNIKKRHEAYAQMISHIRKAYTSISQLRGIRYGHNFSSLSTEAIINIIKEWSIPSVDKKNVIDELRRDRDSACKTIAVCEMNHLYNEAFEETSKANNYWLDHELYFRDDIYEQIRNLIIDFKQYLSWLRNIEQCQDAQINISYEGKASSLEKTFVQKISEIRNTMKKELSCNLTLKFSK